ncbi:hypothetical protein B0H10DRAFT_1999061 [Mycena sp. CBHHK59/15]|nr:hypothetical protein B0H10DRAFT_1999061 [Mycena sp. CBHHK59/15]
MANNPAATVTTPAAPVVAARPLSVVLESAGAILIYHPACPRPTILLRLEVYPIRGSPVAGVPLALVLDACQIIANNARGYLTLYGDQTEIAIPSDTPGDLLRPGKYHYRVPSHTDGPYPICLEFRAWEPPVAVPQNWAHERWAPPGSDSAAVDADVVSTVTWSNLSHDVKRTDGRCAVTGDRSRLNTSHLIPQAESTWFEHYRPAAGELDGGISVDNAHNVITLCADLNKATFDEGHFVLFPYQGKVVTIFMTLGTRDLAQDFHLSAAEIPVRIFADYLYARFAWSIFKIAMRWLRAYEMDADVAKVAVPAALQPKPTQLAQGKKRKWEGPGGPEDAVDGQNSNAAEGGSGERGGADADEDSANGADGDSANGANEDATDEDSSLRTDGEDGLDVYRLTDADVARAEAKDAELQRRRSCAEILEDDPCYPGYSKALRLAHEYRRQHPEVSAVWTAWIACIGEDPDG